MTQRSWGTSLLAFAGVGATRSGHLEKWVSGAGGFFGILGIVLVSQATLGFGAATGLVASMGASAVLLFAVPHGPLSQPWPVFGGHMVSAFIGVTCVKLIPQSLLCDAVAVGTAIGAMYYLRCTHPPGGATALTAAAGGDALHSLGYQYLITPVLLNVLVILLVAILFNYPFRWRRYPAAWARGNAVAEAPQASAELYSREELTRAILAANPSLSQQEKEVHDICRLARTQPSDTPVSAQHIKLNACYSNGEFGDLWQVRKVTGDASAGPAAGEDRVTYRVVAGRDRRAQGTLSREAFARWARYEVTLHENAWRRVQPAPPADGDASGVSRLPTQRRIS